MADQCCVFFTYFWSENIQHQGRTRLYCYFTIKIHPLFNIPGTDCSNKNGGLLLQESLVE